MEECNSLKASVSWLFQPLCFSQFYTCIRSSHKSDLSGMLWKTATHTYARFYLWRDGSENQISYSIHHVVLLLIHLVITLFQSGNLQTHFFPVCRSQSSKLVEVFFANCFSGSGLLLGQKMSVQPFPQLLSSHTHAHTHPFFCSFTTVCLQGKRSYPESSWIFSD